MLNSKMTVILFVEFLTAKLGLTNAAILFVGNRWLLPKKILGTDMCFIKKLFCKHQFEKKESYGPVTVHRLDGTKETFHAVREYEVCNKCKESVFVGYNK